MIRLALLVLIAVQLQAASWAGIGRFLIGPGGRRITAIAACAGSLADQQSTFQVLAAGGRETNPLFLTQTGQFRTERFYGVKLGTCAGALIGEEIPHWIWRGREMPVYDIGASVANVAGAAVLGHLGYHNRQVLRIIQQSQGVGK